MGHYGLSNKLVSLPDAVEHVPDGAMVALGGGLCSRLPMALVRELIRAERSGLHVVGSAHSIDVDLLVAASVISTCEESYVGFEQDFGLAPAYRRAAETGTIHVKESCCYSILTQLRAAEWGLPFLPVGGVIGTDVEKLHPEYRRFPCPLTGQELVALPALRPDVALIHAYLADEVGNLHIQQPYVLDERFAAASRKVVATAERIVTREEIRRLGITVPAHRVAAVVEVPFGAHPSNCYPRYAYDREHIAMYMAAAQEGGQQLDNYLKRYVTGGTEADYRAMVGDDRLEFLESWASSESHWKAVFA